MRFIREVLGVEDATDLIEATPQLASMPLAVLAARHAYLRRVGAPHGAQLATPGLRPPLLGDLCATPATHDDFAEACGGDESDVAALVAAFRRGGRRAAADGDALLVRDLLAHGWAPAQDRDRRGASAAHVAAGRGAVDVLGALIASDASLARDRDAAGATPLHWAACGVRGTPRARASRSRRPSSSSPPAPTRARRRTTAAPSFTGRRGREASRRADAARGGARARRQRPRVHLRALGGGRRRHRRPRLSTRRLRRGPRDAERRGPHAARARVRLQTDVGSAATPTRGPSSTRSALRAATTRTRRLLRGCWCRIRRFEEGAPS